MKSLLVSFLLYLVAVASVLSSLASYFPLQRLRRRDTADRTPVLPPFRSRPRVHRDQSQHVRQIDIMKGWTSANPRIPSRDRSCYSPLCRSVKYHHRRRRPLLLLCNLPRHRQTRDRVRYRISVNLASPVSSTQPPGAAQNIGQSATPAMQTRRLYGARNR